MLFPDGLRQRKLDNHAVIFFLMHDFGNAHAQNACCDCCLKRKYAKINADLNGCFAFLHNKFLNYRILANYYHRKPRQ